MPNFVFSRLERLYLTLESTYGQAVAPGNDNACRLIKASMDNEIPTLVRRDKFGSFTPPSGVRGRVRAKWNYEGSLVNGSGGVPDADVLWQLLFSNASSGGVYTLSKASTVSANLWDYRDPSTAAQRVALGAVMSSATINLGQDIAEWQCEGEAMYVNNSLFFSTSDTTQKGGLVSFPAEPGSPVTHGGIIAGFTGSLTVDGITLATIRTATIKVETGVALVHDTFGTYYSTGIERGTRKVTFGFNMYEDDSSGQETIYAAAESKALINASCQIGTVTGSIFTFALTGIQLDAPTRDDSQLRFAVVYPDATAHGSGVGEDELTLTVS